MNKPSQLLLPLGEIMPNSRLPVLVYPAAVPFSDSTEQDAKRLLSANKWGGQWTNGVFDYDHFHPNAHEALAIVGGWIQLRVGGEVGITLQLDAGDIIVLPAGTGHRCVMASGELSVVGAYPKGQERFRTETSAADVPDCREELQAVAEPETDPVFGKGGPLVAAWRAPQRSPEA